jgi:hypothetical protein
MPTEKRTHLQNSGEKGMNRVKYFIRKVEDENVDTHKLSFFKNFISGICEEFAGRFLRDEEMLCCRFGIFREYFLDRLLNFYHFQRFPTIKYFNGFFKFKNLTVFSHLKFY